ncbi:hypothetical protein [Burkholderia contaminans]|uniref:hypothetical protein n=1 Tax=Burkholderia contaminans TaxID=488447 RepID=UPI00310CEC4E
MDSGDRLIAAARSKSGLCARFDAVLSQRAFSVATSMSACSLKKTISEITFDPRLANQGDRTHIPTHERETAPHALPSAGAAHS